MKMTKYTMPFGVLGISHPRCLGLSLPRGITMGNTVALLGNIGVKKVRKKHTNLNGNTI
jgi:hypothetical protein